MNLFDKPYLRVDLDSANGMLIQTWKGYCTSEQYRDGIEKSVEFVKQKKTKRILIDLQQGAIVKKEDTEWLLQSAVPRFHSNGIKYQAFIYPTNVFAQMTVKKFDEMTDGEYKSCFFDNVQNAKDWLVSNP